MRTNLLATASALALFIPASLAATVTFTTNTLVGFGVPTYDGQDVIVRGCTLTVNGPHSFHSLRLTNSGVLTHSVAPNGESSNLLNLTINQDLVVDGSSRIDVSTLGYTSAAGPGAGGSSTNYAGSGAGHGGLGGIGSGGAAGGGAYDSVIAAALPGSGGGNGYFSSGGRGGGVARLVVGGTLAVNGGLVAADGGSGWGAGLGGGGSGGTLALTAGQLYGFGLITASGGPATSGGGGSGGRVVLNCASNLFKGTISAYGGAGFQFGGAGTVLVQITGQPWGELRLDNGGNAGQFTPVSSTPILSLTIANAAVAYPQSPLTNGNLTVRSNGWLTCQPGRSALNLTVLSNAVIQPGGAIDVSGEGFPAGQGTGAGGASFHWGGGGGGHGGEGADAAAAGGSGYDSILAPVASGSGGGDGYFSVGGAGGGSIFLSVGGALQVDGMLKADGASGGYDYIDGGGGAGGSLFLGASSVTGSGIISVNGGSSPGIGGGGGGGRIALYYVTNSFHGALTAYGGDGLNRGGAGTVFAIPSTATNGLTLIDNGGNPGGVTRLDTAFWPTDAMFDLTVAGAATVVPNMPLSFGSVLVTSGGILSPDPALGILQIVALEDIRVDAGSAISADGLGYGPGSGPGTGGNSADWGGGGGGYGGAGGGGYQGGAGGSTYGSSTQPMNLGSSGGYGYFSVGGPGGGLIRLSAGRIMQILGGVTANGGPGSQYIFGGGGTGGSIFLTAGILSGTGRISANGAPARQGGGGGGGRVAVYGNIEVDLQQAPLVAGGIGGDGSNTNRNGQAGTVVSSTNLPPFQVSSMSPTGPAVRGLSNAVVTFNSGVDAGSFTAADVSIVTPSGPLSQGQINVVPSGGPVFTLSFPPQTVAGQYTVRIGPQILDVYGRGMDQNGNGIPVESADYYAGVFSLPAGDVGPGTPSNLPPALNATSLGSSFRLEWPSQPGRQYQIQTSTDLVTWVNAELPVGGTGGTLSFSFDPSRKPNLFVRILAGDQP